MTLWLDVEDLFHYATSYKRPSGIQRVSFELYRELHAILGDQVRFCRHDPAAGTLRTVPWSRLDDVFSRLRTSPPKAGSSGAPVRSPAPRRARRLADRVPFDLREPLAQAAAAQRRAFSSQLAVLRHGGRAVRAVPTLLRSLPGRRAAWSGPSFASEDVRQSARPGDVFGILGSPWFTPDYAGLIRRVARDRGLRTALLVYDLIPLFRPEWCDRGLVHTFRAWFTAVLPQVDTVLAISGATVRDVDRWAERSGIPVARPIRSLPLGTGLPPISADAPAGLPPGLEPGTYVLFVSTIEARKNHLLAFRVWRRLLDEMPPDALPRLVFAGRVGWLVDDLMQQLANCGFLDGKIVLVADPTDAELAALYRGCRFTLFPSLYEGWGLPVSESLSFGKVCVASDRTAVPEAGGPFCLYVDPEDISGAALVIRSACTDPGLIQDLERKIAAEFRPTAWRSTAEALLDHLGIAG